MKILPTYCMAQGRQSNKSRKYIIIIIIIIIINAFRGTVHYLFTYFPFIYYIFKSILFYFAIYTSLFPNIFLYFLLLFYLHFSVW
jgi:hypothetical protein